ncbi:hypothetical protein L873DRAFT_758281 [Choiromyces venosus 120613-1]|uniref:Uncharacterized protein n=1 Tax=Choiromyces venosus 120613-1 TaxID=1336337 RepID=A0A3N4JTU8_9PEZI|nr:hypothetical protein L873DRAFT_758281 [Choiromyces venosus 120613-1]
MSNTSIRTSESIRTFASIQSFGSLYTNHFISDTYLSQRPTEHLTSQQKLIKFLLLAQYLLLLQLLSLSITQNTINSFTNPLELHPPSPILFPEKSFILLLLNQFLHHVRLRTCYLRQSPRRRYPLRRLQEGPRLLRLEVFLLRIVRLRTVQEPWGVLRKSQSHSYWSGEMCEVREDARKREGLREI